MKVSGLMTKLKVSEFIPIITVQNMKANGFKINNMAMVSSNGQMEPSLKVNMKKV